MDDEDKNSPKGNLENPSLHLQQLPKFARQGAMMHYRGYLRILRLDIRMP